MPSSNGQSVVHFWAGRGYPVGWLFTPGRNREPKPWLPYAIDNGKFGVYLDGREWEEENFLTTLRHFQKQEIKPRWAAVPDIVANKEETLKAWAKWVPRLSKEFSFDWAFVAQDGMTPCDVPTDADVVFIGGSKAWKWKNAKLFTESFPRVHIGGVNSTVPGPKNDRKARKLVSWTSGRNINTHSIGVLQMKAPELFPTHRAPWPFFGDCMLCRKPLLLGFVGTVTLPGESFSTHSAHILCVFRSLAKGRT